MIGILGSNGRVGRKLIDLFIKEKYKIKCATLRKSSYLEEQGIEYQKFDIRDKQAFGEFCKDVSLLVGAAGPSNVLSQAMYDEALAREILYIDPMGDGIRSSWNVKKGLEKTSIIDCGLMPGFTGFLLASLLKLEDNYDLEVEMVCGGNYKFSPAATGDVNFVKNNLDNNGFMKSIENGTIKFTSRLEPRFICSNKKNKAIPYLTKEMVGLAKHFKVKTINNFIVMPDENSKHKNDSFNVELVVYKGTTILRTIGLGIIDPDYVAAYMIYKCTKNILKQRNRKYGLISCYEYMMMDNFRIEEIIDEISSVVKKQRGGYI